MQHGRLYFLAVVKQSSFCRRSANWALRWRSTSGDPARASSERCCTVLHGKYQFTESARSYDHLTKANYWLQKAEDAATSQQNQANWHIAGWHALMFSGRLVLAPLISIIS